MGAKFDAGTDIFSMTSDGSIQKVRLDPDCMRCVPAPTTKFCVDFIDCGVTKEH
jgi:hypothetical protein